MMVEKLKLVLDKHEADKKQKWSRTSVKCIHCRKTMWSNKKEIYCPTCCISKEIKG